MALVDRDIVKALDGLRDKQLGWIVAEAGRQPWVIQDLLPAIAAVSQLKASSVQVTFWLFAVFFTALLIAEISIIVKQIRKGFTS